MHTRIDHFAALSRKSVLKGFTLIELMVTIALIAILGALAAPSIQQFVVRSTIRAVSNDFSLAMQRARTEAINRNECVVMCMSSTAGSSSPTCINTGSNWGVGWIVFRYPACSTSSGNYAGLPSSNADIILAREAVDQRYQLVSPGGSPTRAVVFNARGLPRLGTSTAFNLSDTASPADFTYGRTFCLNQQGRLRVLELLSNCSGG
ncbi:GspH/FimT family pseudopilin [Acidovorax lacteus]|uniref:Type II secretion system protein H n=1 Tax=Acidovorax lacteus TaxID=1924988 RepID=A0ABP8LD00_9BURK